MIFFFGVNNNIFKSEIQIPLFKNRVLKTLNLKLFKCFPKDKRWILKEVFNKKVNEYFYILKNEDISNNEIYFLADETIFNNFDDKKIKDYNNFTDTSPAFRANFKIYISQGGFSSYQSEYPYSMITKKGTILSSISSLANTDADKNYILIKNIFEEPIEDNFKAYLVNYKTKTIEEKYELKTNNTNCIEINKNLIKPEIFLITEKYLGIPMYISLKNNFLSFEHTHPPHEYILSENKFVKISSLKKEINEIIS
jgi:hypothetical protein